jgi:hypothetical protein
MMKPLLLCFLAIKLTMLDALAQGCERTLSVGFIVPSSSALEPADFEAVLGKQALTVIRVEPIRSSRILILIASKLSKLSKDKSLKRLTNRLLAIDRIPPNVAIAYAVEDERKIAFSGGFTSDPQELRNNLQKLVSGFPTESHIRSAASETLNFFGQPQAGDSVLAILPGSASVWVTEEDFLEKGIRLFVLPLDSDSRTERFGGDEFGQAEATGGHWIFLASSSTFKKEENANWLAAQDFLMNGISRGYMVTVSIPPGIRVKPFSWVLKAHSAAAHPFSLNALFGIPSPDPLHDYPDLLLCDNRAKNRVASAVRPRTWWRR